MTQSIAFIMCDDEDHAKKINAILKHPMYKFINDINRFGNFNNLHVLQKLPKCDDYENVYKKFNITPEELNFIETNI